ncbi:MAG: hypothetical protein H6R00_1116 [Proteobacteria bacterium]|nr:hypothetical protein [Pseudomonadota bacterium]
MTVHTKIRHGTSGWFKMVGAVMAEVARRADLPADLTVSLVERYTDGVVLSEGLVQGIRFDIVGGKSSYRVGARLDEQADIMIEMTAAVARELNALRSTDPRYRALLDRFLSSGEMRMHGDISRLGDWLATVHDPIVDRTG